jgi:hypothetical protein
MRRNTARAPVGISPAGHVAYRMQGESDWSVLKNGSPLQAGVALFGGGATNVRVWDSRQSRGALRRVKRRSNYLPPEIKTLADRFHSPVTVT